MPFVSHILRLPPPPSHKQDQTLRNNVPNFRPAAVTPSPATLTRQPTGATIPRPVSPSLPRTLYFIIKYLSRVNPHKSRGFIYHSTVFVMITLPLYGRCGFGVVGRRRSWVRGVGGRSVGFLVRLREFLPFARRLAETEGAGERIVIGPPQRT
ncbi:hypothetical protein GWI33_008860 [Rhynchophorus ferrugineus]|uniref:Uncharacterized protein n=1 Tax=Rhynchophorus ferrugineus TaxID=354439 RepID=A0A834MAT8_RHYFE|nr:hypothetical protein GWI33_008860 [Rhynchophorus ferrugineus]